MMNKASSIDVYMDGQCPLCNWMRSRVEPFDSHRRINWLDFHDPETLRGAAPHTLDDLNTEMYVKTAEGRWFKGFFAWIEVIRRLPALSWLAPLLLLWPIRALGPALYRILASRRYTIFGVPPPCSPEGVCKLHK
jgi:predicted DCC family thiol-disulfide oxidoreductase YuxK